MKRLWKILKAKLRGRYRGVHTANEIEQYPVGILTHWMESLPLESVRMVPVVVLDASERPDISQWMLIHRHSGPGDVKSQWALSVDADETVYLMLELEKPVSLTIIIEFELPRDIWIIDRVIRGRALQIKAGRPGLANAELLDLPGVLLDIGALWVWDDWESRMRSSLERYHTEQGRTPQDARKQVDAEIASRRAAYDIRL